jgi:hypothetical protein
MYRLNFIKLLVKHIVGSLDLSSKEERSWPCRGEASSPSRGRPNGRRTDFQQKSGRGGQDCQGHQEMYHALQSVHQVKPNVHSD